MTMYNQTPARDTQEVNKHLARLRKLFQTGKTYRYYVSATRGVVIFFNDKWITYKEASKIYKDLEVS